MACEVSAKRARRHRDDDIGDAGVERLRDVFDIREREGLVGEYPIGCERTVEARVRARERFGRTRLAGACPRVQRARVAPGTQEQRRKIEQQPDEVAQTSPEHHRPARYRFADEIASRRHRRRVGALGGDLGEQPSARHAVRQRVVHLRDVRDVTAGEALDEPHLPERSVAIEARARDRRDHFRELAWPAGRPHRGPPVCDSRCRHDRRRPNTGARCSTGPSRVATGTGRAGGALLASGPAARRR